MKKKLLLLVVCMSNVLYPKFYGVVLAGGVGERLWPLSRQHKPKQLLKLGPDKTLLMQAIDRLKPIVDRTWVVTAHQHADMVKQEVANHIDYLLEEPCGRNTAPAIVYTLVHIIKQDPDAVILFVPADPFIPESDYQKYQDYVLKAYAFAQMHDEIVLLGVKPTYAATGYGYIEYDPSSALGTIYKINRFHEKPSLAMANTYRMQPNMLWNIGMFCAKASLFLDQCKRWAPDIYQQVDEFMNGTRAYHDIQSISIDYTVMERSNCTRVQPVDFSWCDVGNVDLFVSIRNTFEQKSDKHIAVNATNNIVDVPDKLVALIGVHDLCVIETNDALLITKRTQAEQVRAVVNELKKNKQVEYL